MSRELWGDPPEKKFGLQVWYVGDRRRVDKWFFTEKRRDRAIDLLIEQMEPKGNVARVKPVNR